MSLLLCALALLAHLSRPLVAFLAWELAWRDYGVRSAVRAFAVVLVICEASHWGKLLFAPASAVAWYYPDEYGPSGLLGTAVIVALSYATGGLTRRIFGAGRRYSLALPALAD
ncbi:MAG: hypothetical protein ABSG83_18730 [Roseiarcus sp.]|jgi:hypothetical protein